MATSGRGRPGSAKYWREDDARRALDEMAKSGLELTAFARRIGVQPQRLRRWQRQLAGAKAVSAAMTFLPVTLSAASSARAASSVEVRLRGGRRIRVSAGADDDLLRRVVVLLESLPC